MSSYFFLLLLICSHWRKLHLDRSFQGHKKRSINHIRHCSSRLFCFGLLYCQKRSVNKGQVKRLSRKCDSTSSQISFPAKLQKRLFQYQEFGRSILNWPEFLPRHNIAHSFAIFPCHSFGTLYCWSFVSVKWCVYLILILVGFHNVCLVTSLCCHLRKVKRNENKTHEICIDVQFCLQN